MFDKFARLREIASDQATVSDVKYWNFERDGSILGTIVEFGSFTHKVYGEQHTVIVRLADSGELVSAFLNGWLQEGLHRKRAAVGDLILIQFLGMRPGERFNRFYLEIEKAGPEMF